MSKRMLGICKISMQERGRSRTQNVEIEMYFICFLKTGILYLVTPSFGPYVSAVLLVFYILLVDSDNPPPRDSNLISKALFNNHRVSPRFKHILLGPRQILQRFLWPFPVLLILPKVRNYKGSSVHQTARG